MSILFLWKIHYCVITRGMLSHGDASRPLRPSPFGCLRRVPVGGCFAITSFSVTNQGGSSKINKIISHPEPLYSGGEESLITQVSVDTMIGKMISQPSHEGCFASAQHDKHNHNPSFWSLRFCAKNPSLRSEHWYIDRINGCKTTTCGVFSKGERFAIPPWYPASVLYAALPDRHQRHSHAGGAVLCGNIPAASL